MFAVEYLWDDNGIAAALRRLAGDIMGGSAAMQEGYQQLGEVMLAAAVPLVPVLSGTLVADLLIEAGPAGVAFVAGGGPARAYAAVQNYGSSRGVTGQHFMEAGAEAGEASADEEITTAIDTLTGRLGLT